VEPGSVVGEGVLGVVRRVLVEVEPGGVVVGRILVEDEPEPVIVGSILFVVFVAQMVDVDRLVVFPGGGGGGAM